MTLSKTIYPISAEAEALPLRLDCISSSDSLRPVSFAKGDGSHTFIFTRGGEGVVTAGEQSFRLSRGSFIFIPSAVPFTLAPEGSDLAADRVNISGGSSAQLLRQLGFERVMLTEGADTENCDNLFSQIMAAAEHTIPDMNIVSSLLYAFLLAAGKAARTAGAPVFTGSIAGSVEHMDKHYGEDISLERLAQISGVSLQHFCRVFRSQLGMRPMEYLARRRVAAAKILLTETDGRIGDIAAAVGFEDSNYFGITFRKYEGVSPTEYRKERGITEK